MQAYFDIVSGMNKAYKPSEWEEKLYTFWEKKKYFHAHISKKDPFCIILPPPNANAHLHVGHAMYVYEDIMIRFNKLRGKEVLWLPGVDHAGFETQYVFEKFLSKQGKSRFDYDRDTLYKMIWDFVQQNRGIAEAQLKKLGFALDWDRIKFTLDEDIVQTVNETFKKLFDDGFVYRDMKLVNYCVKDGTSFSDLEVVYKDNVSPLYYLKYGPFELATTRPETKFGDTAVAVNPKDKRYQKWVGQELEVEGLNGSFKIKVVADEAVDPEFGTGVVKVTPAHDFNDFEIAQRHNLPLKQVIGYDGRLNELTGPYQGLKVMAARAKVVEDLKKKGLLVRVDETYQNRVATCYRCGSIIEPLPKTQWFVKVKSLTQKAKSAVESGEVKVYPTRFKKILIDWLDRFHDWNISRQIVWGIRIPAYRCTSHDTHDSINDTNDHWFVSLEKPDICKICGKCAFVQDEDTFDTWFSSGQWPFATLKNQADPKVFDYFYPTSVMETGYDILPWWVARMIMFGLYRTGKVPFKLVFLHGMVRDRKGQKMSKSKGNVVNPMDIVEKYGADSLRAMLIFQSKEGGDVNFTEDKIIGMRNYANKIWNIGRFLYIGNNLEDESNKSSSQDEETSKYIETLSRLRKEFDVLAKGYIEHMEKNRFSQAFNELYEFLWHRYADVYLEELKEAVRSGKIDIFEELKGIYVHSIVMLHPFMPFLTEAIWKEFYGDDSSIIESTYLIKH